MKRKYDYLEQEEEHGSALENTGTERNGSELRMFVTDQFAPWVSSSKKTALRPEIISSPPIEPHFTRLPTRSTCSQVRVYEQTGNFPSDTQWGQRLFVTHCSTFRASGLERMQALFQDSFQSLAVLFHMHKVPNTSKGTRACTKPFFLSQQPHLATPEEISAVKKARRGLCRLQGDKFLGLHCQKTLVEFLFGSWSTACIPKLVFKGNITDAEVRAFIEKPPTKDVFRVPFIVRKRNTRTASWCCLQNKDKALNQKLLSKPLQAFFAGIYLSLQLLWQYQQRSEHPLAVQQNKDAPTAAVLPPTINTYCVESRDELTVIGKHLIFCLENLDHLWFRYFRNFKEYIESFAKAPRVWLELERRRLCLSVQIHL